MIPVKSYLELRAECGPPMIKLITRSDKAMAKRAATQSQVQTQSMHTKSYDDHLRVTGMTVKGEQQQPIVVAENSSKIFYEEYASMSESQFDELGCHSESKMHCLEV